ncbi:MAG TPA: hypothetical protein VN808_10540 [Stellaceae bacterium]|nr:hypothetical protein [Stellaceae bacterium]
MRVPSLAVVIMLGLGGTALAQNPTPAPATTPPPPEATAPAPPAPQGITRDDYITKARDAAEKRAATRFDAMDVNHDGILTPDEIAAYRAAHARHKTTEPQ